MRINRDPIEYLWSLSSHAVTNVLHTDRWALGAWIATLSRIPLALACIVAVLSPANPVVTSVLIIVMMIVDILDGRLFTLAADRRTQLHRKLLDAVLDRVIIQSVLIAATLTGVLPVFLYAVFTARESALTVLVVPPLLKDGRILNANLPSRIATALMGLIVVNHLTPIIALDWLVLAFMACATLGLAMYARQTSDH